METRIYQILIGFLGAFCACLILVLSSCYPVRVPFQGGLELFGKFFFGGEGAMHYLVRGDSSGGTVLVPSGCALIEVRSAYVVGMWPGKAFEVTGTARREISQLYFVAQDDGNFYFFETKDLIKEPSRPVKGAIEFYDREGRQVHH